MWRLTGQCLAHINSSKHVDSLFLAGFAVLPHTCRFTAVSFIIAMRDCETNCSVLRRDVRCHSCSACLQSKDSTVFFMNVGDPYEPIGFIPVPAPVLQLVWTPEKYVSCQPASGWGCGRLRVWFHLLNGHTV